MSKLLAVLFLLTSLALIGYNYANCQRNPCLAPEAAADDLIALVKGESLPQQQAAETPQETEPVGAGQASSSLLNPAAPTEAGNGLGIKLPPLPALGEPETPAGFAAWNDLAAREVERVRIEIARLTLADASVIGPQTKEAIGPAAGKPTALMLLFKVKNNGESAQSVYPTRGEIMLEGERVYLSDYPSFGDSTSEIAPGETRYVGVWVGLDTPFQQVQTVRLQITPPSGASLPLPTPIPPYQYYLDLSRRAADPMPAQFNTENTPIR